MSNEKKAFVVVDLVNDFVEGKFGSNRALEVTKKASRFLSERNYDLIIFTMDSHIPDDPEFRVWGEHCLQGQWGSELQESLNGISGYHIKKRHFDSFFDSDLDGYLRARGVTRLYLFGISTDICVLHTAAGAFFRGYSITVIGDLCASISEENHMKALEDMKRNYGVAIINSEEVD
ncbi:MAG: cysteine hydrolase [Candidatus Thermoplasmatota archaeon]|nr:cysteine hydrolase [Candidatus Thermoplasmatota archaeon]